MGHGVTAVWTAFHYEMRLQLPWMSLNFVLAVLPALGAAAAHRWWPRLGQLRWPLLAAVAIMLPNAPYVVTDLVHLRTSVDWAPHRIDVWAGILPLFALLIASGVLSYAYTMHLLRKDMRRAGWSRSRRALVETAAALLCALGVALGRISRLNSWDVFRPGRLMHGLHAVSLDPRAVVLALVIVLLAGVGVDWAASGVAHSVRDRVRHR
ncbi:MAG TPA: DUF1361 domain-containing protein [Acidimicrobiales bacterium]|nr:DUF1361 domain-containing protein [Acidimicrobiales bacterium]